MEKYNGYNDPNFCLYWGVDNGQDDGDLEPLVLGPYEDKTDSLACDLIESEER